MRKSSIRSLATDISPETQEREVRALAARHGDNGDQLGMLADWDISGRGQFTRKRTGYLRLVQAIESGEASAVYSYSLSRLGRSVADLSHFFDLCDTHRVPVRLVVDSVDTSTASGRLLANVLGSVAQFEADVASERVRAMYATKRARGEEIRTSRRYGESDGEDDTMVLAAFREARSYAGAARLLNQRGVKPRSAKHWWASSVAVVVARLDPDVARRPPTRGYPAGGSKFVLARLLRCPTCGTRLTGARLKLPKGGTRVRYACRFAESMPHPRVALSEHLIMPAIRREVEHLVTPGQVDAEQPSERELAALQERRARVLDMYEAGHVDRTERDRRLDAIYDAMAKLDGRRVVLNVPSVDWTWETTKLNAVLGALFEVIELDPVTFQPVHFVWRIPEWRATDVVPHPSVPAGAALLANPPA